MSTKTVHVTINLPMNLELTVEPIDDGDDFDVKDVSVMPIQSVSVSDVNEAIGDDSSSFIFDEIMRQLND